MSWIELLEPNLVLGDSIFSLTPEILQQNQLKGLVLDVDETLVPIHATTTSEDLQRWVAQFKPETSIWLASNNLSKSRIEKIAQSLEVPYIAGAAKPSRRKLRHAIAAMALPINQVAMVGDRVFTDVLVGNRLGMFTILVEPIVDAGQSPRHLLRSFEVWLSKTLGASLPPKK